MVDHWNRIKQKYQFLGLGGPRSNSPTTISSSAPNLNSVRISQQGIVPRTTQPPLASAYFPGQKNRIKQKYQFLLVIYLLK
jgi:hypothetical protein